MAAKRKQIVKKSPKPKKQDKLKRIVDEFGRKVMEAILEEIESKR